MDQPYQCLLGAQDHGPFSFRLQDYSKIWLRKTLYSYSHTSRDVNDYNVKVPYIQKIRTYQQNSGTGPQTKKSTDGSCGRRFHLLTQGPANLGLRQPLCDNIVVEGMI